MAFQDVAHRSVIGQRKALDPILLQRGARRHHVRRREADAPAEPQQGAHVVEDRVGAGVALRRRHALVDEERIGPRIGGLEQSLDTATHQSRQQHRHARQEGAVGDPAHGDAVGRARRQRRVERRLEGVPAVAPAGIGEVAPPAVGENPRDDDIVDADFQAHRRLGVVLVIGPAGDALAVEAVDVAAQRPRRGGGAYRRGRHAGARREDAPHPFQRLAALGARQAELPAGRRGIGVERRELGRVVEHRAAVAIDEGLRRRALGQDHVVGVELEMEVVDQVDRSACTMELRSPAAEAGTSTPSR